MEISVLLCALMDYPRHYYMYAYHLFVFGYKLYLFAFISFLPNKFNQSMCVTHREDDEENIKIGQCNNLRFK